MQKLLVIIGLLVLQTAVLAQKSKEVEFIIKVAAQKEPCSGYEGQTECYLIAFNGGDFELSYEYISGFNYTPGFEYTLKVKSIPTKNGMPDMPERVLKLVEVIEAVKPPQH